MIDLYSKIREYRVNGYLHCVNGPAKIWDDRIWGWWLHGVRHRYYGPAGMKNGWFFKGKWLK